MRPQPHRKFWIFLYYFPIFLEHFYSMLGDGHSLMVGSDDTRSSRSHVKTIIPSIIMHLMWEREFLLMFTIRCTHTSSLSTHLPAFYIYKHNTSLRHWCPEWLPHATYKFVDIFCILYPVKWGIIKPHCCGCLLYLVYISFLWVHFRLLWICVLAAPLYLFDICVKGAKQKILYECLKAHSRYLKS